MSGSFFKEEQTKRIMLVTNKPVQARSTKVALATVSHNVPFDLSQGHKEVTHALQAISSINLILPHFDLSVTSKVTKKVICE